jgi:hypothetical protein
MKILWLCSVPADIWANPLQNMIQILLSCWPNWCGYGNEPSSGSIVLLCSNFLHYTDVTERNPIGDATGNLMLPTLPVVPFQISLANDSQAKLLELVHNVNINILMNWTESLKQTDGSRGGGIPTQGKCGRRQTMGLKYCWITTASQELCAV